MVSAHGIGAGADSEAAELAFMRLVGSEEGEG
jgi:hypothetical protein